MRAMVILPSTERSDSRRNWDMYCSWRRFWRQLPCCNPRRENLLHESGPAQNPNKPSLAHLLEPAVLETIPLMRDGFHGNLFTQRVRNCRPVKEMNNGTEEGTMTGTNISDLTWEDILDDDMKAMVPKFWLKFKPPSLTMQYLMGTLYALIMIAGTCGNIIIIWLFCTWVIFRLYNISIFQSVYPPVTH